MLHYRAATGESLDRHDVANRLAALKAGHSILRRRDVDGAILDRLDAELDALAAALRIE